MPEPTSWIDAMPQDLRIQYREDCEILQEAGRRLTAAGHKAVAGEVGASLSVYIYAAMDAGKRIAALEREFRGNV